MISPACFLTCNSCGSNVVVEGEYVADHDMEPPAQIIIPKAIPPKWSTRPKFPGLDRYPDPFGLDHFCPDPSCQENAK